MFPKQFTLRTLLLAMTLVAMYAAAYHDDFILQKRRRLVQKAWLDSMNARNATRWQWQTECNPAALDSQQAAAAEIRLQLQRCIDTPREPAPPPNR